MYGGLTFAAAEDDVSRAIVYFSPWFEYDEMKFVASYLRAGDSVLDVGANAGAYSLLAASAVGSTGHVDAVEPVAVTVSRLRANIRANSLEGVISVHAFAVGESDGAVAMTSSNDATNHVVIDGPGDSVTCVRLDTLMNGRSYAFAKMDIEGMEWPALKGSLQHLLAGNPPVWMIEINGSLFRYGYTVSELLEWIDANGYDVGMYDHASATLTVTKAAWGNVFLVHRASWALVRERMPLLSVTHA